MTEELVAAFRENWDILPKSPGNWRQKIWIPFRYLMGNKFWKLYKDGIELSSNEVEEPNSINDMRRRANYAAFAPDLWELLQDTNARTVLRQHLLQVYFGISPEQVQPVIPADPL